MCWTRRGWNGTGARAGAVLVLGAGLLAAAQATPPSTPDSPPPPTALLRVTTRVVAISAVVKSHDGKPATGLTSADFDLRQDGKPVDVRYCAQGADLPLTLALMVDTSGSQRTVIGDESIGSDVFLQTMLGRPQDRAVLVQFDSRVRLLGSLTASASALHLSMIGLAIDPNPRGGTLLNDAVSAVSQRVLAHETGRRAMILLTDGGDNGSRASVEQAIQQAQLADVQVYSILYTASTGGVSLTMGLNGVTPGPDPGVAVLRKFSESTGGQLFEVTPQHTLRQIYAEIAQDLRLQYQVSYTPPPDLKPGSYHKLDLRTKDRQFTVEARKGFFARP